MAAASHAQGQTPTSPRERPTTEQPGVDNNNNGNPPGPRDEPTTRPRRGLGSDRGSTLGGDSNSDSGFQSNAEDNRVGNRQGGDDGRRRERSRRGEGGGSATQSAAGATQAVGEQTGGSAGAGGAAGGGATGGGGGGGGATFSKGGAASVNVVGDGAFEPILTKEVVYGEVPDEGDLITLEGPMTVNEFLQAIHLATTRDDDPEAAWNILASEAAAAINLQFMIAGKTPRQALEILKFHDIVYDWDDDTRFLKVYTKDEWLEKKYGDPDSREFQVKHADVLYMESLLGSLLSATGRIITDQRTGRIYVWDTPANLEQMEKTFTDVDVPQQREAFTIQYADLPDIEAVVSGLLSPNGSVLSDARTGQVIVWDGPTVLQQVEDAIERLDVPVETRSFQIVHVNAEDLVENLEVLLSEKGMIQVDPRYNTLVITELPARMQKIADTISALDRELETRTWTILYADPDFIADQIELYVPSEMGAVVVNYDVHQVTVSGLQERLDKIDQLIKVWDIRRQQVLIEAFIVEVGTEVQRELNINWSYFDNLSGSPFAFRQGNGSNGIADRDDNPITFGQLPYGIPLFGGLQLNDNGEIERPVVTNIDGDPVIDRFAGDNLAATLNYLDRKQKVRILNSPRVVVQDGEEALFQNATQVPFVSGSTNFGGTGINNNFSTSNRVEFIDVGTILSVMPRVSQDNNIVLDVNAEDSTFTEKTIIANDLASTVPEKTTRGAETQLRVRSGDTVVLGGLRRDRASDAMNKLPLLGDIPLLGRAFRSPNRQSRQSDLMIFLTATIVGEETHPEAEALARTEQAIDDQLRKQEKTTWGRLEDKLSGGENEIVVAIGQGGNIHSEGEPFTLEQVAALFETFGPQSQKRIIVRSHPRAPKETVNAVIDAATSAGLKVKHDQSSTPLIPVTR